MQLTSSSFIDQGIIPGEFAFAVTATENHIQLSSNRNPDLSWLNAPSQTQSFALICHDPDVPSQGDQVNQEGQIIPAELPRVDFYHWVLINIPASETQLAAGTHSSSITAKGKSVAQTPIGLAGINDYTAWFKGDPNMSGDYYGYDGPCPPWNDSIKHHYVFTIYALDIKKLELTGPFTGNDALQAMSPHILDKASITGIYSLNPSLKL
jgi:Raf kinase inhibitor-like YbhB/YbcL family protein